MIFDRGAHSFTVTCTMSITRFTCQLDASKSEKWRFIWGQVKVMCHYIIAIICQIGQKVKMGILLSWSCDNNVDKWSQ